MITTNDPVIAWFVDRVRERKKFQKIIEGGSDQRIMMVQAGPGMGKTWLISNFRHECSCRQLPYAIVDFGARPKGYDYLEILRSIRDALGAQNFKEFTALVNQFYIMPNPFQSPFGASSSSAVDLKSSLTDSKVDNVAGRDIIRDNNFFYTRPDTPPELIRSIITEGFINCLMAMNPNQLIVWLFDTFEKIDPITNGWLIEEFLQKIKNGTLKNLVIVLAGQKVPPFSLEWKGIASMHTLEAWSISDYQEYLEKKRMGLDFKNIQALHRTYSGRPLDLAMWVDAAFPSDDDDEDAL